VGVLRRRCARRPLGKLKKAAHAAYFQAPSGGIAGGLFDAADYELDRAEVWPENWPAWQLFCRLSTQWRIAMNGPTGLDYQPLMRLLDLEDLSPADWQDRFDDVRVLEAAALEQMRSKDPVSS
jgi:hypothetical protein